ncbi:MAG TPA: radical SAM protein [Oscillospiraceae bacterium]|nr:radical SAM protein [Oscillospiraceae bacterium]
MGKYYFNKQEIDSVELKCLLVSRGLKIDKEVYKKFGKEYRLHTNALTCNCLKLPDDTIVMATDLSFHLSTLSSMFSWENMKLIKYMSDMTTDFRISLSGDRAVLLHKKEEICPVSFMPKTDFYERKTSSGLPFLGNAVLQGRNWVAFQCLWPCEYAMKAKACQYCFSGGQFEALAKRGKAMPPTPGPQDVADIINYAIDSGVADSIQITGGSTFSPIKEEKYISAYMESINSNVGRDKILGEILLYITPPEKTDVIDRYFELGADRIACSLEVWDDKIAAMVTLGKREYTTKDRHLRALEYISEKHGKGKAFSNFIIGLEPLESLKKGASCLAQRGVIPSASIWMPFGKPVMGSMTPPGLDYFRAVKEMLAELYLKYGLEPPGACGLNVCVERDIYSWATKTKAC